MLLVSFTKVPRSFPSVFIITGGIITLVPVNGIALTEHRVFVLGGNLETLDGAANFEVGLNAISTTYLFDAFTKCVEYDNVTLGCEFIGASVVPRCKPFNCLTGGPVEPTFHLVQSPFRKVTLSESLPQMVHFFLEQLRTAAHCFGPMGEGVNYTKLGREVMVAVPL